MKIPTTIGETMRPIMNLLLPLTLLAASAVPTDPARAEGVPCPRAAAPAAAAKPAKAVRVEVKKEAARPKLEAL